MSESDKSSWDRERIGKILDESIGKDLKIDVAQAHAQLVELLGSVRREAVDWAWTEARSQHAKGLDPRKFEVPLLMDKANADLNPERYK